MGDAWRDLRFGVRWFSDDSTGRQLNNAGIAALRALRIFASLR